MFKKIIKLNIEKYKAQLGVETAPIQVMVHTSKHMDRDYFALPGIQNISKKLQCTSYEIPEYLDYPNFTDDPGSYLGALPHTVINTYEAPEYLKTILNSPNEIILTGGFYRVCHLAWFKKILMLRIEQGLHIEFHFPADAIFPVNKELADDEILASPYFNLIQSPYNFFDKHGNNSLKDLMASNFPHKYSIPGAIFKDNRLLWSNTYDPAAVVNYWSSSNKMFEHLDQNYLKHLL